jgi:hypothetical protein
MSDPRSVLLALLRDDLLTPWFNRQDLAAIALDHLAPDVHLDDVDAVLDALISEGALIVRLNRFGDAEVALAECAAPA